MAESKQPYPSRTKEAFRLQKRKQRKQEAELLQQVNERLAALNIDWKQLMLSAASGEVEIVVKSGVIPE